MTPPSRRRPLDETDIRMRPNPKGSRPRSKERPQHSAAVAGQVVTVDRGRYGCLLGGFADDRQTGVLTRPDPNLETLVRQSAEQEILKAALEDGILEQAQVNAEAYLFKFFSALGFPNTIFVDNPG